MKMGVISAGSWRSKDNSKVKMGGKGKKPVAPINSESVSTVQTANNIETKNVEQKEERGSKSKRTMASATEERRTQPDDTVTVEDIQSNAFMENLIEASVASNGDSKDVKFNAQQLEQLRKIIQVAILKGANQMKQIQQVVEQSMSVEDEDVLKSPQKSAARKRTPSSKVEQKVETVETKQKGVNAEKPEGQKMASTLNSSNAEQQEEDGGKPNTPNKASPHDETRADEMDKNQLETNNQSPQSQPSVTGNASEKPNVEDTSDDNTKENDAKKELQQDVDERTGEPEVDPGQRKEDEPVIAEEAKAPVVVDETNTDGDTVTQQEQGAITSEDENVDSPQPAETKAESDAATSDGTIVTHKQDEPRLWSFCGCLEISIG